MHYEEFKGMIQSKLQKHPSGLTWVEIKKQLDLPYKHPCPSWIKQMEQEIGLLRVKETQRAYIWKIPFKKEKSRNVKTI